MSSPFTSNPFVEMTPERILTECNGFYRSPSRRGRWLGPFAGYTSRDKKGRNRLGPHYANFEMISKNRQALRVIAARIHQKVFMQLDGLSNDFLFCGIPTGGREIVKTMRELTPHRCMWLWKKTVGKATKHGRAPTKLVFAKRKIKRGEQVVIVEDVGNAFSSTVSTIELIEGKGGTVIAIAMFLNRSMTVGDFFEYKGRRIPVIALWREPMPIFEQDDKEVYWAVRQGRVVWKPKSDWSSLMEHHQEAA